jgi:D-sedoheptulose 7-phosphate isomerase
MDMFGALPALEPDIAKALGLMREALLRGNKLLVAGNGGSAADAQHFAGELVGRFQRNRRSLPCLALSVNTSNLTAIGNDFGFEQVFARQVEGLGSKGDVFLGLSTSGDSVNILKAVEAAHAAGLATVGLLGRDGGALKARVQEAVIVPHAVTARIQEAHIFILHYWAEMLERDCAP